MDYYFIINYIRFGSILHRVSTLWLLVIVFVLSILQQLEMQLNRWKKIFIEAHTLFIVIIN